jgi:hypothetical protein
MTEPEARQLADYVGDTFEGASAVVQSPRQVLRLAWDRETAVLVRDGLVMLTESGRHVPQGMIDNLDYWITRVAQPSTS